nr:hypothetical protein [Tanacetum cinerariifolium]
MINPNIKIREIMELLLKKYKCNVNLSQAKRGKIKALSQYPTCLEDHYGMLWSYASEILKFNPGSTSLGTDGNKQFYPIAWVVVNVENTENWSWFMKCLIDDVACGESKFKVRNGYEAFRVDERLNTCSCRACQLSGLPSEHGCATIYFLHKEPEDYIFYWYEGHNVRGFTTKDGGSQFVKGGITARSSGSTMGGKTVNKSASIRVGKSVNASGSLRGGESGSTRGIPVPAGPYDGTPDDLLSADEIPVTNTQPMTSQEPVDKPSLPTPTISVPAHALVIRRE